MPTITPPLRLMTATSSIGSRAVVGGAALEVAPITDQVTGSDGV